jgi:acetolactate synthase-1/3 small subunit
MSALSLELDLRQGTLQRLVGMIERRGFEIVHMELSSFGTVRHVHAEVQAIDGARDFDVLCRQVDRLQGMRRVSSERLNSSHLRANRFPLVG